MMQKLFTQQISFKDGNGNDYQDWEEKRLEDILFEHKTTNHTNNISEVFSVSKHKGVINQIEHLGRSYAADSISHYKVANPFDVIYTKSPTSEFPFGIIKQNLTERSGVVSPLYAVFRPLNQHVGYILHTHFLSWVNTYNYLNPLVQKGAKNTMSIRNDDFLNGAKINFPNSTEEQTKIANFLASLDNKINLVTAELIQAQTFKKGLLQQMFI
jgi:type I restriction enzyme, S subunit